MVSGTHNYTLRTEFDLTWVIKQYSRLFEALVPEGFLGRLIKVIILIDLWDFLLLLDTIHGEYSCIIRVS